MLVHEGSRVRAGEKIAEVGENSSGVAMLHFEIREAGDSVDPSRLLPPK
jgi:lipoprotein NlpD